MLNEVTVEKHSECGLGRKNGVSLTDSWSHRFTAAAESRGLGRSSTSEERTLGRRWRSHPLSGFVT